MKRLLSLLGSVTTFVLSAWPLWVPVLVIVAGNFPLGLKLIILALALLGAVANGAILAITIYLASDKAEPGVFERAKDLVGKPPVVYLQRGLKLALIWIPGTGLMIFAVPDTDWLTGLTALFMFFSTAFGIGHSSVSATVSNGRHTDTDAVEEG